MNSLRSSYGIILLATATMVFVASVATAEYFYETVCTNSDCSEGCSSTRLDTGACYGTSSGDTSIIVRCRSRGTVIEQVLYEDSKDCDSFSHTSTSSAGECGGAIGSDQYIMFLCEDTDDLEAIQSNATTRPREMIPRKNVTLDLTLSVPKDPKVRAALSKVRGIHRDLSKRTVFIPAELMAALRVGEHRLEHLADERKEEEIAIVAHGSSSHLPPMLLKAGGVECTLSKEGLLIKESVMRKAAQSSTTGKITIWVAGTPAASFILTK